MSDLKNVHGIGSYSIQFKKWLDTSMKDLTRDTYAGRIYGFVDYL